MNVLGKEGGFNRKPTDSWILFYFLLFLISLVLQLAILIYQYTPGYMDAEYYYSVGIRLVEGEGFTENFLWNYLNDPTEIPQPSHLYWMPLTSLLSALGMMVIGSKHYYAARMLFILVASVLPALTSRLALIITEQKNTAVLAGILSIFGGFYFTYIGNTDTFAMQMLLGALFMLSIQIKQQSRMVDFLQGLLIGLFHLNRADGILWIIPAIALLIMHNPKNAESIHFQVYRLQRGIFIGLGYLIPMGRWYIRNIEFFNSLFPPGNSRALWITNYEQLFSYPSTNLTFLNWAKSGINAIVSSRINALGSNLMTFIAVQGLIILTPLIIIGLWNLRTKIHVQIGVGVWGIIFVLMTLFFPFAGDRGGFFHSGAAIQPLFFVLAAEGFYCFIRLGVKLRSWNQSRAQIGFAAILVVACIFVTVSSFQSRMFDPDTGINIWNDNWNEDLEIEKRISEFNPDMSKIVVINDPPGFSLVSKRTAIMVPNGDINNLKLAATQYKAEFLVIEEDHLREYSDLYENPGSRNGLYYLGAVGMSHLYEIDFIKK